MQGEDIPPFELSFYTSGTMSEGTATNWNFLSITKDKQTCGLDQNNLSSDWMIWPERGEKKKT